MSQQQKTRRQTLEEVVGSNPDNAFARYGLAMECVNAGEDEAAREHFCKLLSMQPDYLAAYYHYGLLLKKIGHTKEALEILRAGIPVARKAGNEHARSELEAALAELS